MDNANLTMSKSLALGNSFNLNHSSMWSTRVDNWDRQKETERRSGWAEVENGSKSGEKESPF